MGTIERIWIKPTRRAPMRPVESARLVADHGIEGNADQRGKRQITVLDREAWERATARLETGVDPSARRANVLLSGIDLRETADRILRLGECRIHVRGETGPCARMDEAHDGLREALEADWAGGVYGVVLDDGIIWVGDPASWA